MLTREELEGLTRYCLLEDRNRILAEFDRLMEERDKWKEEQDFAFMCAHGYRRRAERAEDEARIQGLQIEVERERIKLYESKAEALERIRSIVERWRCKKAGEIGLLDRSALWQIHAILGSQQKPDPDEGLELRPEIKQRLLDALEADEKGEGRKLTLDEVKAMIEKPKDEGTLAQAGERLRKILVNNAFRHETDDEGYWAFLDSNIKALLSDILKEFKLR